MGCVASKLEEEEEVLSICRERKRLMKLAVEKRCELADAHCRYCQSLYAVAAAIKLFVARHSSPISPFLINFSSSPPTEQNVSPSEPTHEAINGDSGDDSSETSLDSSEPECKEEVIREEEQTGCFYMQMNPPMPFPRRDFGWDFFNPFDGMRADVINGYGRSCGDDLREVREQEGIPELEEEEKNVVFVEESDVEEEDKEDDGENVITQEEERGFMENIEKGRELLEAMKDIEDYFIKAYESGKDVSRMLEVEANIVSLQSGLDQIKVNSAKVIQAFTWNRSNSCKSIVASSFKSSSTWNDSKNALFDVNGGMASGSHSLTLERLYAWEKKLYEEVKTGDSIRKIYEKKCSRLENQEVKGYNEPTMDKTRGEVKDLYSRILVAIRSAESISKQIQKLRDEELEPQIAELLKGLMRTWKVMLESHETQNKILLEVKSFSYGKFSNDSHRFATLQLEAELQNWRSCFTEYVEVQRAYVEALHGWLTKFVVPEVEVHSRRRSSAASFGVNGPPLLVICYNWLSSLEKLPDKAVSFALKSFSKDVRALWAQQGEEQQQKSKIDSMAKELDRRTLTFQKAETGFLESKLAEHTETEMENRDEHLIVKKDQVDILRKRLDIEKEKHQKHVQETQSITLIGFQTGFSSVFESLAEFSKVSLKMYSDIVAQSENAEM